MQRQAIAWDGTTPRCHLGWQILTFTSDSARVRIGPGSGLLVAWIEFSEELTLLPTVCTPPAAVGLRSDGSLEPCRLVAVGIRVSGPCDEAISRVAAGSAELWLFLDLPNKNDIVAECASAESAEAVGRL